jgi:flagellar biosynthesis chaperone FliJ
MRTALVIAALVMCASAAKLGSPMNTKPERSLVQVMTQIETALKTGGAIEIINKTLDNFENEITAEQASHDELIERSRTECASEFDFRRREVADAVAALREGQATLEGAQDQLRRASSDLTFVQASLIDYRNFIELLGERREREAAEFGEEQTNYEFNVAAVNEAVELLEGLFEGEEELIQLSKHSHKLLKAAMSSKKPEAFAETFAVLAALKAKENDADLEILERVRNVLTNLSESLNEDWEARVAAEQDLIEQGEAGLAAANGAFQEFLDEEAALQIEISELNRSIVTETGVVATSTAKRDRNQRLWDDATELCQIQEDEYAHGTDGRRQERDLIDALRAKVQARFGLPE